MVDAAKYMKSRLESNGDLQRELLIEAVKRFREAESNGSKRMRIWYRKNMHRIATDFDLHDLLTTLLNA